MRIVLVLVFCYGSNIVLAAANPTPTTANKQNNTILFADTDGDGIDDDIDLDDDNDGILDTEEGSFEDTKNYYFDEQIEQDNINYTNCSGTSDPPLPIHWGASVTPFSGNRMIGFHEPEIFDLQLPAPMDANTPFVLSIATAVGAIVPWSSNFGTQIHVYAANNACNQGGQLIGTTTWRANEAAGWILEDLTFTPTDPYTHLIFVADSDGTGWNPGVSTGYILVDGLAYTQEYQTTSIYSVDLDSDNDGISDLVESGADVAIHDPDGNGTIDGPQFTDINGNGLADSIELINGENIGTIPRNSDTDTIADFLDLDSDNDGIPDTVEAFPTLGYINNDGDVTNDDLDGDGVIGLFDTNDTTTLDFGGSFVTPQNTDVLISLNPDALPDYLDTDSDGDGLLDSDEGGSQVTNITNEDPNGSVNNPLTDLMDAVLGNNEVAYRESCIPEIDNLDDVDICGDSYILPELVNPMANYFTASSGGGTPLNSGDAVLLSSTVTVIYIYAETGTVPNCSIESTFTITSTAAPVLNAIPDVLSCDTYILPEITGVNLTDNVAYYAATGGLGTFYIAGDAIDANEFDAYPVTLYAYDANGDCTSEQAFELHVVPPILLPAPTVAVITCDEQGIPNTAEVRLDTNLITGGAANYTAFEFTWDNNTPNNTQDDVVLQTGTSALYVDTDMAEKNIIITVYDNLGCTAATEVTIPMREPLTAQITDTQQNVCVDETDGSISIAIDGGLPPYTVSLANQTGTDTRIETTRSNTVRFAFLKGGERYTIHITDTRNCSVALEEILMPAVDLNANVQISYDCMYTDGDAQNTVVVGIAGELVNEVIFTLDGDLSTAQLSPIFTNVTPGTHSIEIAHENGCINTNVTFSIQQKIPLTLNLTTPNLNTIVAIASGGSGRYQYRINEESFSSTNEFEIKETGTYTITVRDDTDCELSQQLFFEFIPITIPDHFIDTDGWQPKNLDNYPNAEIKIYDRYGRVVAELNPDEKWHGTYRNSNVPSGDYWYVMRLNVPEHNQEILGNFTLMR